MHPYGYLLHTLRVRAGLTQKTLAEMVGILPNYLSQVENGVKPAIKTEKQSLIENVLQLSLKEVEKLRNAANVSVSSFSLEKYARPIDYEIAGVLIQSTDENPERYLQIAQLALEAYANRHVNLTNGQEVK